jgi:hypothetical protein
VSGPSRTRRTAVVKAPSDRRPMPDPVARVWRWCLGSRWARPGDRRGPTLWHHPWAWRPWCWVSGSHEPWTNGRARYCLTCGRTLPTPHRKPGHRADPPAADRPGPRHPHRSDTDTSGTDAGNPDTLETT